MKRSRDQPDAQKLFVSNVRRRLETTRPFVNYLKDFERRAQTDPKGCAEEALAETLASSRTLRKMFKGAFGLDLEKKREWLGTVVVPVKPLSQEFFLTWLYWHTFNGITLTFYRQCLDDPNGPHEGHARAMCAAFVKQEMSSWFARMMVEHKVVGWFPEHRELQEWLVESFTAYFVAHMSLRVNSRLRSAVEELRQEDETQFEALVKVVASEVMDAWHTDLEKRNGQWFQPEDLLELRTDLVHRVESRIVASQENEVADLAAFVTREENLKLLKQGREAGLPPREYELFCLVMSEPKRFFKKNSKLDHAEAAREMGLAVGTIKSLWSRVRKTLAA
jgi:hypothetical protein